MTGNYLSQGAAPMARIIAATSQLTGVSVSEILGKCRVQRIVCARYAAIAVSRKYLKASMPRIARAFNRDYSTINHALRRVEENWTDDDKADFDEIARRAGLLKENT